MFRGHSLVIRGVVVYIFFQLGMSLSPIFAGVEGDPGVPYMEDRAPARTGPHTVARIPPPLK